ncbi:MAG: DUF2029 domain-containing protein [Candidatus Abyssubacteria bacterium]|nr:DUF2029 domain-containing protein [Candidatus Abyssubacteria bacterium]
MQGAGQRLTAKYIPLPAGLRKILLGLLCLLLLIRAAIFFFRAFQVVVYPYEWSTMDGYFVYYGLRLISGKPIYFDYHSLLMPFEYVPLYPVAMGVLARIFGLGVWYERSFSLVCSLLIAILVGRVVARATRDKLAAAAAGMMFFAPASLSVWYIVRGIDIFTALLALLGVVIVSETEEKGWRRIVLAAAILVLAFYAKQTAVFPAAAAISFLLCRDLKKGLLMGACFAGATAAIFVLLQFLTEGWFYENAFLTTARNPYHLGRLFIFARNFLLGLFAVVAVALFQSLRGMSRRPGVWTFYFFFTLLSTVLAGKAGAALSYFLPFFSATCICAGLALGNSSLFEKRRKPYLAILVIMLIQAAVFFREYVPVPSQANYEQAATLDTLIRRSPGKILTERIDSFAVLNGRELSVEAVQLTRLIIRGRYDQRVLVRAIDGKEFSLIIYSGVHFRGIPEVKRAIFENYTVIDRIKLGLFYGETTFVVLAPD